MTAPRFDDQMASAQTRYAQVVGGGLRNNAPKSANVAQGGQRGAAPTGVAPGGAGAAPTADAMNPLIPGVPPIFPASGATSLDKNVAKFQGYAAGGVKGFADMALQDFSKNVGETLGGINAIGGLRSGAVPAALNDLTTNYARQIGDYAATASAKAAELGQNENDLEIERRARDKANARGRRASFLGGVGTLLGAGAGFLLGGPAGLSVGAGLGGKVGTAAGGG